MKFSAVVLASAFASTGMAIRYGVPTPNSNSLANTWNQTPAVVSNWATGTPVVSNPPPAATASVNPGDGNGHHRTNPMQIFFVLIKYLVEHPKMAKDENFHQILQQIQKEHPNMHIEQMLDHHNNNGNNNNNNNFPWNASRGGQGGVVATSSTFLVMPSVTQAAR